MVSKNGPYGMTHGLFSNVQYPYIAQTISDALKLGLNRIRWQLDWQLIESTRGNYNWTALDYVVGKTQAAGIAVCYPIRHTPSFYTTGGNQYAASPTAWATFAGVLAKRYNGKTTPNPYAAGSFLYLDYIEIGNEEFDIPHESNWLPVAAAACPAIVANSPTTQIGPCSLLIGNITGRQQFLTDTYNYKVGGKSLASFFSYWNIHFYKSGDPQVDTTSSDASMPNIITKLGNTIKSFGDNKPIRFTEFGWNISTVESAHGNDPTGDPNESQEATYYFNVMEDMRKSGIVSGMDLYTMNYNPTGTDATKGKSITCPPGFTPGPAAGGNYYKAFFTVQGYITNYPTWTGSKVTTSTKDIAMRALLQASSHVQVKDILMRAGVKYSVTTRRRDIMMRAHLQDASAIAPIFDSFVRANQPQWGNASDGVDNWIQASGTATASIVSNQGKVAGGGVTASGNLNGQSGPQTSAVGPYTLQVNEWNSSATLQLSYSYPPAAFTITNSAISNATNGAPGNYTSYFYGNHWGSRSPSNPFPLKASGITAGQVLLSMSGSLTGAGAWDFSYDNWFVPSATDNQGSGHGSLEMMIWLNRHGGVQPAGSVVASNVSIGGNSYDVWWNGSTTLSYVFHTGVSSVTSLDYQPIIADAIARGYLNSSWYLIDIEGGFEIWQGGTGLALTSFSVVAPGGVTSSGVNTMRLGVQTLADVEASTRVSITNASDIVGITLRDNGLNNFVRLRVNHTLLELDQQTPAGGFKVLGSSVFTPTASTEYWMKFRALGVNLYGKIWQDGTAEPANWQVSALTTVTGAGQVGLACSLAVDGDISLFDHFNAATATTGGILPNTQVKDIAMRAGVASRATTQLVDIAMRAGIVDLSAGAITVTTYAAKRPPLIRKFPKS